MAYTRRWVGVLFALVLMVLLSACGSQEVKFDTHINTPVILTEPLPETQQDPLNVYEFAIQSEAEDYADPKTQRLIQFVASRFKKPLNIVERIVLAAQKYAKPDFPTQTDILAIIAVESSFNTTAHHNGSWGLMQIEAKSHRDKFRGEKLTDIDTNIRVGTQILCEYYDQTHSRSKAIMAYNVGIGNFFSGIRNHLYLGKVNREKTFLSSI